MPLGVPERTIISWRDKYNWVQRRSDSYAIVEQETFNEALANIRARQKLDVERLDLIKEVSVDAIHDEGLEFKDKKQAVDSYIRAQQTIEGMVDKELSRALILEIGTIINEEVKDAETKKRSVQESSPWSVLGELGRELLSTENDPQKDSIYLRRHQ